MTKHYSQKETLILIMKVISKNTPRGILNGDTQVGHITWQMYLMKDYLKLDGTPLANASNDYSDLLEFAQDNNLITNDSNNKRNIFEFNIFNIFKKNKLLQLTDNSILYHGFLKTIIWYCSC